jgi:hypothetical protein
MGFPHSELNNRSAIIYIHELVSIFSGRIFGVEMPLRNGAWMAFERYPNCLEGYERIGSAQSSGSGRVLRG